MHSVRLYNRMCWSIICTSYDYCWRCVACSLAGRWCSLWNAQLQRRGLLGDGISPPLCSCFGYLISHGGQKKRYTMEGERKGERGIMGWAISRVASLYYDYYEWLLHIVATMQFKICKNACPIWLRSEQKVPVAKRWPLKGCNGNLVAL